MHFTRPKGVFGNFFWLTSALHIHGFQAVIGAVLLHKTFRLGCPIWIQKCPDDPISEKKLIGTFINFIIFGLWAVTSQTFDTKKDWLAETSLYGFRDFYLENFSHQKKYTYRFLTLSWWLSGFWSKNSKGSLKLLSMCPEEIFEGTNFQIQIVFLQQFVNLSGWFSGLWRQMSQTSPKLNSNCPE